MNIETIYAAHKSSINNKFANTFAPFLYFIPAILALIPYAQYIAWIIPMYLAVKETDSDLIKYSGAQSSLIYFFGAMASLIVTFCGQLFAYPSSCVITAVLNFTKNPTTAIFYILIYIVCLVFAAIPAKYAKDYTVCKLTLLRGYCEKLASI